MKLITITPPLSTTPRGSAITAIVLHATAGSTAASSINHLRKVGLGYHYIIARDSKDTKDTKNSLNDEPVIYFCCDPGHRVGHVASSVPMPGASRANISSIGISLANRQTGEGYPPKQLEALDELITDLKKRYPTITHLTTHAAIQPWNRADPKNIDASALAKKHGLTWFQPDAATIAAHRPKPVKPPK